MIEKNFVSPFRRFCINSVNKACKALHVPAPPFVFVTTEVFNADGSLAFKQHEQSKSWNRNFYNFCASILLPCTSAVDGGSVGFGAGSTKLKATSSTVRTGSAGKLLAFPSDNISEYIGTSTNASYGLFVGTGTGAESFEDYALGAMIANGSSAGQLAWDSPVDANPTYASEIKKWTKVFYRDFSNNSGDTINVGETGLYLRLLYDGFGNDYFMTERNLLASPVAVADAQILRVTYTTEITFPA
jgi:hypothetical protein